MLLQDNWAFNLEFHKVFVNQQRMHSVYDVGWGDVHIGDLACATTDWVGWARAAHPKNLAVRFSLKKMLLGH